MNYEDDELADAALLLAHAAEDARAPGSRMPAALEAKVLAAGIELVQKNRYSTTKAGAIVVDAPPEVVPLRRSSARAWSGWFAAAACVAVAVYAWRSTTLEREAREAREQHVAATARADSRVTTLVLRTDAGAALADVVMAPDSTGELVLGAVGSGAVRFDLWLSAGDREHALPVGKLVCAADCQGKSFHFTTRGGPVRAVWLTRSAAGEGAETRALATIPEDDVVAAAGSAARRSP